MEGMEQPAQPEKTEHNVVQYKEKVVALYDNLLERGSPKLENALDKIDFDLLKNIFLNKIGKYVQDESVKEKFISRWRIGKDELLDAMGTYRSDMQAIFVNVENIEKTYESERLQELSVLDIVCHEETHALSDFGHTIVEDDKSFYGEHRIGFDKSVLSYNKIPTKATWEEMAEAVKNRNFRSERFFRFLNEGITEKFARGIFDEYVAYKVDLTPEEKEEYNKYGSYRMNIIWFESLCGILAKELGEDPAYIENAFYSSMFGGDDLSDPEIQKAIDAVSVPGLSQFLFNFEYKEEAPPTNS